MCLATLRKATTVFVISVRPSARPQGKNQPPLGGFLCNFILENFSKICLEN